MTVRRLPTTNPPRVHGPLRRRLVVGVLVVLVARAHHALVPRRTTTGPLSGVERPARRCCGRSRWAERVAQPFRDAYGWADSLLTARSDAEALRAENEELRQRAIQNEFALQENVDLGELLEFRDGPRFPARLRRSRGRGDRPAERRLRAGDRGRGRARTTASGSTIPSSRRTGSSGVVDARRTAHPRGCSCSPTRRLAVSAHRRAHRRHRDRPARARARARRSSSTACGRRTSCASANEIVTAGWRASALELALPEGHPDREGHERRADRHRPLPAGAGRPVRRLRLARRRARARADGAAVMTPASWLRAAVVVFVVALLQVVDRVVARRRGWRARPPARRRRRRSACCAARLRAPCSGSSAASSSTS